MAKAKDLTGQRFGSLVVKAFGQRVRNSAGISVRMWDCVCDCGGTSSVSTNALSMGNTTTCGCKMTTKCRTHGVCETRQYGCWTDMKTRCDTPQHKSYANYGGRGITYCAEWKNFENFWEDMKDGYSDGLTIDRIDVNKDYCKANCQWTTMLYQAHNRRKIISNTSGVTGVRWFTDKRGSLYAVAESMLSGNSKSKHFSVKKHGLLPAFSMACDYREKMIVELNAQGAGYSESHGK